MNAEQYKRANNNNFFVCIVIMGAGLILTVIKMVTSGVTPGRIAIIIAAALGGTILTLVGSAQSTMMLVAGISLLIGACCVTIIKVKK